MSASSQSRDSEASTPSLHPALFGAEILSGSVPTISVCPLPLPGLPHEQLLPELSHELKTPLTGIMGLAQVLQRYSNPVAERECQYAELIYEKSQQLLVSINDLFDLAQLCTHQFVLQLRPIDLSSVVKTALKVAQYATDAEMPAVEHPADPTDGSELWMMGDLPRLEQLLTHSIGYFSAQGTPASHPVLKLRSRDAWISITFVGTLRDESAQAQEQLSWPYQSSDPGASAMPGRSSAVLKFLLAKQLAQLHGGDISWIFRGSIETEVTILLPRDLTRATVLRRPKSSQPLFLLYSQPAAGMDDIAQMLQSQGILVAIGRSPDEIQEKIKILSPEALVLESGCVEAPEWPALQALLTGQSTQTPVHPVWLTASPSRKTKPPLKGLDVWPLPLEPDRIAQTLALIRRRAERGCTSPAAADSSSKGTGRPNQPARVSIVLQLDSVSSARPPVTIFVELLACLSGDFGCSILVADNPEQADLLAKIWKPQAIVCTGSMQTWAVHFSKSSVLAQLPFFFLALEGQELPQVANASRCRMHPVDRDVSTRQAARHLYEALTAAVRENA
ncbi:sensor histidine kinase [Altericista sp. CCNU0014]|uniref:sensor histidine kinase n=1 Tax=Altericista sp. CCNU0014 TaxID=3082949 RepID=UPI00384DD11A